jgi:hypothetical protein
MSPTTSNRNREIRPGATCDKSPNSHSAKKNRQRDKAVRLTGRMMRSEEQRAERRRTGVAPIGFNLCKCGGIGLNDCGHCGATFHRTSL